MLLSTILLFIGTLRTLYLKQTDSNQKLYKQHPQIRRVAVHGAAPVPAPVPAPLPDFSIPENPITDYQLIENQLIEIPLTEIPPIEN